MSNMQDLGTAYTALIAGTLGGILLRKTSREAVPDMEKTIELEEVRQRNKEHLYQGFVTDGLPSELARCIAVSYLVFPLHLSASGSPSQSYRGWRSILPFEPNTDSSSARKGMIQG